MKILILWTCLATSSTGQLFHWQDANQSTAAKQVLSMCQAMTGGACKPAGCYQGKK